jgi:ABC-type phosphate transport system substrate-binding protein
VSYRPFVRLLPALLLGILFSATPARGQDGYRVIVNVANPLEGLTKSEAARLFLTRATWDSGEQVYPVNLEVTSAVREEFSRDVLGVTATAATQQWKRATGDPPAWMATEREVLAFIRLKRGAIGYVSAAANLQGVKVLTIVKTPAR